MHKKDGRRIERDHLGEVEIPSGVYWGIRTYRAQQNFAISGLATHPRLIDATMLIKKAAAFANSATGRLDKQISHVIAQAADEILNGQWRDQFVVDPYHAGGGTSHNNNVNEVLANRGSEILGGLPGTYTPIHPDKHVNMAQSTNDVFPSAMRLAILLSFQDFEPVVLDLERLLRRKSLEFDKIIKTGRTHLQDTVPISLGQEFNAYGSSVERSYRRIKDARENLLELNIGAGEVGTGTSCEPGYTSHVMERLLQFTGLHFKQADDYFRLTQSMADFMQFSSALKELAVELTKIANDLRLLCSGPKTGFAEIRLPIVDIEPSIVLPGILPDKANPVLAECLNMVAYQVVGNDLTVMLAAQAGQLELNVMSPIIIHNILQSMDLLKNALSVFNQRCVAGIAADTARCRELFEASRMTAIVLLSHIGHDKVSELTQESLSTGRSIRELVLEQGLMPVDRLDKLLQDKSLLQPGLHKQI